MSAQIGAAGLSGATENVLQDRPETEQKPQREKPKSWVEMFRLRCLAKVSKEISSRTIDSRMSVERPQTHHLPPWVMLTITALISICVAITNFGMVQASFYLMRWKYEGMQAAIDRAGLCAGTLVLVACCVFATSLGAAAVVTLAPVCSGGGLPEMKGYLNGNKANGLFRARNFFVRVFGTVASVVGGLPIGREGPSISAGCNVGYGVVTLLAKPYVRRWVNIDATGASSLPALFVDEGRLLTAKRLGCALGGAAGMAAIFDAPVGGLLYMLEEVSEMAWTPELTLRTIVGTVLCVFVNRALMDLAGDRITDFLIYVTGPQVVNWGWADLPWFIVLAVALGILSSTLTHALAAAFQLRQRLGRVLKRWHPFGKIAECALHAAVCASVFVLVSWAGGCQPLEGGAELHRLGCPEGEYSPAGALLLQGSEESIKQFYTSTTDGRMEYSTLILVFVAYTALFVGTIGLAIPMGTFIPAMFIGGLIGRGFGKLLLQTWPFALAVAKPHIYAVVGSAAMLSAFTRQTLAIVVFMIECANDLHLIPPLMLAVFISHRVADSACGASLDERLIELKGVPFLEPEIPRIVEQRGATAADLCDELPVSAVLPEEASVEQVRSALVENEVSIFPVVRAGCCVGLATRPRLEAVLRAIAVRSSLETGSIGTRPTLQETSKGGQKKLSRQWSAEVTDAEVDMMICNMLSREETLGGESMGESGEGSASSSYASSVRRQISGRTVHLSRLMDTAPYTVLENMPGAKLYPLFTRLGIRAVCVISLEGKYRGVISRDGLVARIHSFRGSEASLTSLALPEPEEEEEEGLQEDDLEAGRAAAGGGDVGGADFAHAPYASAVLPQEVRSW